MPVTKVEAPPVVARHARRSQFWIDVAAELRATPGEWRKVGVFSAGMGAHIRAGRMPSLIPDEVPADGRQQYMADNYEVQIRAVAPGDRRRANLYMRFIG